MNTHNILLGKFIYVNFFLSVNIDLNYVNHQKLKKKFNKTFDKNFYKMFIQVI